MYLIWGKYFVVASDCVHGYLVHISTFQVNQWCVRSVVCHVYWLRLCASTDLVLDQLMWNLKCFVLFARGLETWQPCTGELSSFSSAVGWEDSMRSCVPMLCIRAGALLPTLSDCGSLTLGGFTYGICLVMTVTVLPWYSCHGWLGIS